MIMYLQAAPRPSLRVGAQMQGWPGRSCGTVPAPSAAYWARQRGRSAGAPRRIRVGISMDHRAPPALVPAFGSSPLRPSTITAAEPPSLLSSAADSDAQEPQLPIPSPAAGAEPWRLWRRAAGQRGDQGPAAGGPRAGPESRSQPTLDGLSSAAFSHVTSASRLLLS